MKTYLKDILSVLKENDLLAAYDLSGCIDKEICSITYDSKKASEGCLFVCKGAAFKKQYLEDAIKRGSICYVSETDYVTGTPHIIVKDIRKAMPHIAQRFYQIPEHLCRIGITGTKGKTTCAYFLKKIFDVSLSHSVSGSVCKETGFITTVETFDGAERISTGITTPESFELYRHFDNAVKSGIGKVIMEISSQGLKYRRVQGIDFDTALFLNISEDHISPNEHEDFEDYFTSKLMIFDQCRNAVICNESDNISRIIDAAKASPAVERIITYGFTEDSDAYVYDIKENGHETAFMMKYDGRVYDFLLNMRGDFNVLNAAASACTAFIYGISYEDVSEAFRTVSVPGRCEEYHSPDGRLTAVVDYAHNGFSFRSVISMAKKSWPGARIVTLFGSPGGKAFNRRKDLGNAASQTSDFLYLTADDPAKEKVEDICEEIAKYARQNGCGYVIINDRTEAIFRAVEEASRKDEKTVLMVLGKGCETAQKTAAGSEYYESDAEVVKKAIGRFFDT